MRILSFDTSANALQLALLSGAEPVYEKRIAPQGDNRQDIAATILPELGRALADTGWSKGDIELVVVGTGPGSFTGIRVAALTARTLGQALALPVVGINQLEAMAFGQPGSVAIVLSAGPEQFFIGAYKSLDEDKCGLSETILEPMYVRAGDLAAQLPPDCRILGDERLSQAKLPDGIEVEVMTAFPLSIKQAQLALARISWKGAYTVDSSSSVKLTEELAAQFPWRDIQPLYLREPSITLKRAPGV